MKDSSSYVAIGKVGRAYGLRGAFFVSGREDPVPAHYGELLIGATVELAVPARIRSSHMQGERPLLLSSLAEFRDQAEALTGQSIFVQRGRIKTIGHEMLWDDLTGADVVDALGVTIGTVHHVYYAGSCDIVEVHASPGGVLQTIDLPLIDAYLAAGQALVGKRLQLSVPAEVFADLWLIAKPRPAGPSPA